MISALPRDQGQALTVTMRPSGAATSCAGKAGPRRIASGKCRSRKRRAAASVESREKEGEPSSARKRVQVKVRSRLGRAMSMNVPRGQMCSAFACMAKRPSGAGGSSSSL